MRISKITISLEEFVDALRDYAAKQGIQQAVEIHVESHGKVKIIVCSQPGGLVECEGFTHRTKVE